MNIGVFCSANAGISPVFFERTRELGQWMGHEGHTLVFGGCNMGLMECVAEAVHEAGGKTIGVVPSIVERGGRASDHVDVKLLCDNLDDRKALMVQRSDLFIALPGGVGTLDEVFTVAAAATIGYHHKPILLYNVDGFWDSLLALMADLQRKGVIRGEWQSLITEVRNLDEIAHFIGKSSSKQP